MTTNRSAIFTLAGLLLVGTAWLFHSTGLLRLNDLLPRPRRDIIQVVPITQQSIHYMLPDDQVPRHVNLTDEERLIEEIQLPIDEEHGRRLTIAPPTDDLVDWGRVKYYGILPATVSISDDDPPVICQGNIVPCQTSGRRMVEWSMCAQTVKNGYGNEVSIDIDLLTDKSLSACDTPNK